MVVYGEVEAKLMTLNEVISQGEIIIPQEVMSKAYGVLSRGVKEVRLSSEGDLFFILTDNTEVALGNIKGIQGDPGFSPTLSVVEAENGFTVIITDAEGQKSFTLTNGLQGEQGKQGEPGKDGESPTVDVSMDDSHVWVTANNPDGTSQSVGIPIPEDGEDGASGLPGLEWQGEWDSETSYRSIKTDSNGNLKVSRDVVFYNGSAYVCVKNSIAPIKGVVPEGDTTGTWELLAQKGKDAESEGVDFTTDETLSLVNGVLSVNRAFDLEADNTLPITSAAVYETVGNIEILLGTI